MRTQCPEAVEKRRQKDFDSVCIHELDSGATSEISRRLHDEDLAQHI